MQSIDSHASLGCQLTAEDENAIYRRMTRILHVDEHGDITDETGRYHKGIQGRGHATIEKMINVMAAPVLGQPTLDGLPDGLNIVRTGHADTLNQAFEFFGI